MNLHTVEVLHFFFPKIIVGGSTWNLRKNYVDYRDFEWHCTHTENVVNYNIPMYVKEIFNAFY
jgi:hypothetical protein